MRCSNTLAAVCVLGALLATAWAADWQEGQLFAEWARMSSVSAKAKTLNDYERADAKHVCLKEGKQHNCQDVGCDNQLNCGGTDCNDRLSNCVTHRMYQSDLHCCDEPKYDSYGYKDSANIVTPQLRVGTCDWDFDLYKCQDTTSAACSSDNYWLLPIPMENGAFKLGTAWATCYLNADSEYCGHPFCDKMVLSFKGGIYAMEAYAKDPITLPVDASCNWPIPPLAKSGGAKQQAASATLFKDPTLEKAVRATGLKQKLLAQHPNHATAAGHHSKVNLTDYSHGVAIMFSGTVSVTSMDHHVEYSTGMMEYVSAFGSAGKRDINTPAKGIIVRPHTYDIVLTSSKSGSYGEEHKDEGYYKEEDHREGYEKEGYYKKEDDEHKEGYYKHDDNEHKEGYYKHDDEHKEGYYPKEAREGYYPKEGREHKERYYPKEGREGYYPREGGYEERERYYHHAN